MKKKTIIQVWGKQGSGKTTTIKIIREELERRFINSSHTYSVSSLPKGEITEIFNCNGFKLGVESMGDYLPMYGLRERLDNHIINEHCDILICASRVYNDVSKHIKELAVNNDYRLVKVTNYRLDKKIETPQTLYDYNQSSAIHIVDLINQIMLGTI